MLPFRIPSNLTVLIVDDDPTMLEYLERLVRAEGFKVETASDGLEFVKKMRDLLPAAAVADLMLPKYGGLEMVRELRRGTTENIRLVIVTARYTTPEDRATLQQEPNVAAYFEKPFDAADFARAVHIACGTTRTPFKK